MTPRVAPSDQGPLTERVGAPALSDEHNEIDGVFEAAREALLEVRGWVADMDALLHRVTDLVADHPERRLVGTRAFLDRAEELRSWTSATARRLAYLVALADFDGLVIRAKQIDQSSSTLVARQMASEERNAMYTLRTRPVARKVAEIDAALDEVRALDRRAAEIVKAIDGHRMEAITLLRASVRVSREEYLSFRRPPSDGKTE